MPKDMGSPLSPNTDFTGSITPHRMVGILELPDDKAEEILFNRLRHLDRVEKLSYAERGMICRQVQNYMLHEQTKVATQQALWDAGAPFEDGDQCDAFVVANAGLSELGLPFLSLA